MRPLVTVTAVVLLHLCVIAVLVGVNGCRSTTGLETDGEPVAYAAGGRAAGPAAAPTPAPAPAIGLAAPAPVAATTRIATPAPTKVTPIAPVGAGGIHVVVKGENLTTIALREKVSPKDLAAANGISLNATVYAGQKLKIPAPGAAAKPAATATRPTATRPAPAAPAVEFTPLRLSTTPAPAEATPAAPAAPTAPAKK
jgi:LysM repeat protein